METKLKNKETVRDNNILMEANSIVNDRSRGYEDNIKSSFENISHIASAIRRKTISPRDVTAVLMALKLSRENHKHKRDNLVDLAGYAQIDYYLAELGHE